MTWCNQLNCFNTLYFWKNDKLGDTLSERMKSSINGCLFKKKKKKKYKKKDVNV